MSYKHFSQSYSWDSFQFCKILWRFSLHIHPTVKTCTYAYTFLQMAGKWKITNPVLHGGLLKHRSQNSSRQGFDLWQSFLIDWFYEWIRISNTKTGKVNTPSDRIQRTIIFGSEGVEMPKKIYLILEQKSAQIDFVKLSNTNPAKYPYLPLTIENKKGNQPIHNGKNFWHQRTGMGKRG